VLVIFLAPLLYGSSIYANFNDFRADLRWLTLNAVALVIVTMGAVAVVGPRSSQACPGKPPSSSERSCRRPTRR
jgi:hypothetical protein